MNNHFLTVKEISLVTLLGVLGTVAWSVHLGQDLGPDLINYHFYSGFLAFHKEKLGVNIFPASMQGYMNPYAYAFVYALYQHLQPIGVGIVLGALHGLNFISVYIISRMLLEHWTSTISCVTALLCAAFGLINPFFMGMIGSSFTDSFTPVFILTPLALVMVALFPNPENPWLQQKNVYRILFISGLMIGMTIGVKLINAIYVIGLFVACILTTWVSRENLKRGMILFGTMGLGFLIVDGEWMWRLYSVFQNPTFPFFNNIFKSNMFVAMPEITPEPYYSPAATSFYEVIVYPFRWAIGIPPQNDWPFRDARFAVLSILMGLLLLSRLLFSVQRNAIIEWISKKINVEAISVAPVYIRKRIWFIGIWGFTSYLYWINRFGSVRYLMPVILLTGIYMLLCMIKLIPFRSIALSISIILMMGLLWTRQDADFGRVDWAHSWYPVRLPQQLADLNNTLYLQTYSASSILIPFFPHDSQFINLPDFAHMAPTDDLKKRAYSMVKNHRGPIRTLTMIFPIRWESFTQFEKMGLRRDPRDCIDFSIGRYFVQSCRLERLLDGVQEIALPLPLEIRFDKLQPQWISYVTGFYPQEPMGRWTQGYTATIHLAGVLPRKFKLNLGISNGIGENARLPIKITIGNQVKEYAYYDTSKDSYIPFESKNGNENKIIINVPKPISPHSLDNHNTDERDLGVFLEKIAIQE